jgi:hypothetical protein
MANDKEVLDKMSEQLKAGKIIMVSTGTPIDNCPLTAEMIGPGFFTSTPHPPRAQLYRTKDCPQADGQYALMRFDDPELLSQLPAGPLSYVKDVSERIKGYQQPARGVPDSMDAKQFLADLETFDDMGVVSVEILTPKKSKELLEKYGGPARKHTRKSIHERIAAKPEDKQCAVKEPLTEKDIRDVTTAITDDRRRAMTGHRGDLYCTDLKNKP